MGRVRDLFQHEWIQDVEREPARRAPALVEPSSENKARHDVEERQYDLPPEQRVRREHVRQGKDILRERRVDRRDVGVVDEEPVGSKAGSSGG